MLTVAASAQARTVQRRAEPAADGILHFEPVAMMSSSAAATQSSGGGATRTVDLSFATLGRVFDLKLEAHDPFAPGALVRWVDDSGVTEEEPPTGIFFRGRVEGDPSSWVRITMHDDALSGIVATGDELYFLEPGARLLGTTQAADTVAFRMSDVDDLDVACGAAGDPLPRGRRGKSTHGSVRDALRALLGEHATTSGAAALKQADLGVVADYEYFQAHGGASATVLSEIVNAVDGIYTSEVGVTVQIASMVIHSNQNDPFSGATVPLDLLIETANWRNDNDNSPSQSMWQTDLTHLFTGRDLNSNVIGIAYLQSLCSSSGSAGVDQDWTTSVNLMSMLVAHEMGHNFGAPHDNQSGSACGTEPGTFIMNPSIGGNLQRRFSNCSKSKINPYVAQSGCIDEAGPPNTPTPTVPPTNTFTPSPTRTPTLGVPAVTAPGAGQVIGVEGVTFSWTAVSGATGYDLRVLTSGGATIFTGTLTGGASTSSLIGMPNNGSYSFRVRACREPVSDATCGAFASRSFSVSLVAPSAAPNITFPTQGAVLTESQQTLSWTAVAGNPILPDLFYEVRLINRNTGLPEIGFRTIHPMVQSSVILASLPYRMQVRACQSGCGPFSSAVDFSVDLSSVPTSAPTITEAVVTQGNILSLEWTAVADAEWYQVQVIQPGAGPGGGALTVASRQVAGATDTELTIPVGQASVIIAGCNGDGCGPYSLVSSVQPTGSNPATPQVGAPLNGAVVIGPSITFTWSRVPGDTGNTVYRLFVQDLSRQRAALDVYTTQNFFAAKLKAEGGRYAVLVIANPGGSEVSGPVSTFTVRGASADAPTLMAPTHGSVVPAGNVLIGWTPVPGATLYEYLVSMQGAPMASGRGVTQGIFVQVPLTPGGSQPKIYNGIVRACPAGQTCTGGSDAGWGPWSSAAGTGVVSFTVVP